MRIRQPNSAWQDLGPRSTVTEKPPQRFERADGSVLRDTEIIAVARGVHPRDYNSGTYRSSGRPQK
jgi:hypothetical protein